MNRQAALLTFRVVQIEELSKVKQEVKTAFFSGDEATIEDNFRNHDNGASTTILGYFEALER